MQLMYNGVISKHLLCGYPGVACPISACIQLRPSRIKCEDVAAPQLWA